MRCGYTVTDSYLRMLGVGGNHTYRTCPYLFRNDKIEVG